MDVRVGLWRKLSAEDWWFWTVVLEKTLESPLDCKEIQPVHSEGDQSWVFFGKNDAKAETPVLWPPDGKNWLIGKDPDAGKDWGQEEKGVTQDEMVGWHHQIHGHKFEQALRNVDGQGSLACCSLWGHKESDMTEWLNWKYWKKKQMSKKPWQLRILYRAKQIMKVILQIGKGVCQGCILSPCLLLICRVHHEKHWAGRSTSWNED